ncbi:MAG: recombinase family protein, partial [Anaerolineae bacterium]
GRVPWVKLGNYLRPDALGEYDDSPEGRLNKHIRATIAEYEREKIRERMVRGRRQAAKSGSVFFQRSTYT